MPFTFVEKPPQMRGSEQEQINALRDYIFRMVKSLNNAGTAEVEATSVKVSYDKNGNQIIYTPKGADEESIKAIRRNAQQLRSLIIKSAEQLQNEIDSIENKTFYVKYADDFSGDYPTTMYNSPTVDTYYMGVCVSTDPTAPSDPSLYTWSRIKGDGGTGINSAPVFLYRRAKNQPRKPQVDLTYTFASGRLDLGDVSVSGHKLIGATATTSGHKVTMNTAEIEDHLASVTGWTQEIPATDGRPCWVITATAIATTATDVILASEWSEPRKFVEDGTDGLNGADGVNGANGTNGIGITATLIEYGVSSSAATAPEEWSTTVPGNLEKGSWLWVKTTLTYSDETEDISYTKSYVGTDGEDGTSVIVQSATKTGNVTTVVLVDSEGHQTTLTINDGEDGNNGTPGTNGLNGYVHTAWANSADGSQGFSTSDSVGKLYLGVYTDNTAADSQNYADYSWSLIKGADGEDGQDGQDGKGIASTTIRYGTSNSASTQPQSWSSSVPTSLAQGKWLWVRTVISYTDSSTTTSYSKSYIGTDGEDGKSVAIQSATKTGGTTTVVLVDTDGNETTLTINDGEDGDDGSPGTNGLSGYVHTAWANSADGATDFSTSVSTNKKYLGVYTDNTQADSQDYHSYSWSLIKGADGQNGTNGTDGLGIAETSITYGVSNSASTAPTEWDVSVPSNFQPGVWLWVKTVVIYTDNTDYTTYQKSYVGSDGADGISVTVQSAIKTGGTTTVVLIDSEGRTNTLTINDGEDGDTGAPGADGDNAYVHTAWANSVDGSTDFSTSVSTGKQYLGVYTDNTAADSQNYSDYSWSLIKGADGQDGADGKGISSTQIQYGTSDSADTQPSSWVSSAPTSITQGKWLWVRTKITYTDNTSNTTYQKSYIGTDGEDGKSVAVQSASKTGGVTTVVLVDSDGNQTTLTINDGEDGDNGTPGTNGTNAYVHTAWANSADGSTDFSTSVSANKKYLGVYTDSTQADSQNYADYSWSLIKGTDGTNGTNGYNTAIVYLYKRAASAPSVDWNTSLTYSFTNKALTSTPSGWSQTVPNGNDPLYVTAATASSRENTASIAANEWATPTMLVQNGTQGVAGPQGPDGRTPYLHIKYSDDGGETFTGNSGEDEGAWIGMYTDYTQQDSNDPTDYTWHRFADDEELQAAIQAGDNYVMSYVDSKTEVYNSLYVAQSEYGTFTENIVNQIESTAKGVVESYDYDSEIQSMQENIDLMQHYYTNIDGEIRRGIIEDPETHEYVTGIAISQNLQFAGECGPTDVNNPGDGYTYYYLNAGQTFGLYTSTGWQFWIDGYKVGWFDSSDGKLHVATVLVEESIQFGANWQLRSTAGGSEFELLYTGS